MIWYIRNMIKNNNQVEEDILKLVDSMNGFESHIEDIHSLEVYYGDQDLQNMLTHSRTLINDFIDFQAKHYDVEVVEEEYAEEEIEQE